MKGPYERLKYDLRRVWECPACQNRVRTSGTTTSQMCACKGKEESPVCMRMIEDGPRRESPLPTKEVK